MSDTERDVNRTMWKGMLFVVVAILIGAALYQFAVPNPDATSAGEVPRVRQ